MSTATRTQLRRRWRGRSLIAALFATPFLLAEPSLGDDDEAIGFEKTPPRLSMVDGEASFWRPGADDWSRAQINTPLAAGDELYTEPSANVEIQVGSRAFVRAGGETQLSVYALEPDYLQLRLADGDLALDLRSLKPGQTFEVSTPNAAFTVETAGYYRVTADGTTSTFISRRGGRALATPVTGGSVAIGASEQIVVTGGETPAVATYAAPEIDGWDRWNYARTDRQAESVSARYVSEDVYGLSDLDQYGEWRQEPTYGAIWRPRHVVAGWSPYSYGRWLYDPFYGWSWVDYSPWGWAPFHYGRWVHVSGYWGWCPGPVVVRPYYAPALVAFYGSPGVSVGVSYGVPFGWVALGWGEPLAPWWGPARFRHYAHWAGWGGPYYVNNVHIHRTKVVHVDHINHHEHWHRRRGSVVVDRDHFGRRGIDPGRRWRDDDVDRLRPVRGELPFRPRRESLRGGDRPGRRPPREVLDRRVVSTREPRIARVPIESDGAERSARRRDVDRDESARVSPRIVQPTRGNATRQQPVREARRGEAADLNADTARTRRPAPPPLRGAGDESARRNESRASRYQDEARRRVERSLEEQRSSAPDPAVRERRREARQAPPLPSRDNASRSAPSRAEADRQRAARPERELRSRPEAPAREPRRVERAAPPQERERQRVERSAPPPRSDTRQRITREEAVRQRPSRESAPSDTVIRSERRRSDVSPRSGASGSSARREEPSYSPSRRDLASPSRERRESYGSPRASGESGSAPVLRSAPRADRGGSMRAPRAEMSSPSRATRGESMSRSGSFRMPRSEGGMRGGGGAMRGERHGGDGRR